jgi:hypothetical protein
MEYLILTVTVHVSKTFVFRMKKRIEIKGFWKNNAKRKKRTLHKRSNRTGLSLLSRSRSLEMSDSHCVNGMHCFIPSPHATGVVKVSRYKPGVALEVPGG